MSKKTLVSAILLAIPVIFSPMLLAAESAPEAVQSQQGMAASEHAGHGESAGMGGRMERGGSGKPVAWTSYPALKTKISGENRERREITVVPQNIVADSIDAYSNDVKAAGMRRQLQFNLAGARLDKPEAGGFHWLAAREEQEGKVRVASTVYFFSERGGQNPTALFMQQKHELEIIPQPFPREHSRYRSNEDWKFLVRFNGSPLDNQKIIMETSNGTKTALSSDTQGVVTARIPGDFKEEPRKKPADTHDHGRRGADFVLATEYEEGGKNYLTAFNASYGPDAFDQRSMAMGLGFTLLGMMGAVPLLRQRKAANKADDAGVTTGASVAPEAARNEEA